MVTSNAIDIPILSSYFLVTGSVKRGNGLSTGRSPEDYMNPDKIKVALALIFVLSMITIGCSSKSADIKEEPDSIWPSQVMDLAVIDFSDHSITISWTAPGDDSTAGRATSYDLRYSTEEFDWDHFDSATQVADVPEPKTAGETETLTITGLAAETEYYIALEGVDEEGNHGVMSNMVSQLCYEDVAISFADGDLEAAIRDEIGQPTGDIYRSSLMTITELRAFERGISDLAGIEKCSKLRNLYLGGNHLTEIDVIGDLHNLEILNIDLNSVSDISPLSGCTKLLRIEASNNGFTDLTPLSQLPLLMELGAQGNGISNLSPLAGVTTLTHLNLFNNEIVDVTPLQNLTDLVMLALNNNNIMDITPLAEMTNLETLYLSKNAITDISALANMTRMKNLYLQWNQLNDITPLAGLTAMIELDISNNDITSIEALTGMTAITRLDIYTNSISDISPLSGMTNLVKLYAHVNDIDTLAALEGLGNLTEVWLGYNKISDILPLVNNSGIDEGDILKLESNPLSKQSIDDYIPLLIARKVDVTY